MAAGHVFDLGKGQVSSGARTIVEEFQFLSHLRFFACRSIEERTASGPIPEGRVNYFSGRGGGPSICTRSARTVPT